RLLGLIAHPTSCCVRRTRGREFPRDVLNGGARASLVRPRASSPLCWSSIAWTRAESVGGSMGTLRGPATSTLAPLRCPTIGRREVHLVRGPAGGPRRSFPEEHQPDPPKCTMCA